SQGAIQHRFFFSIACQITVTECKLLKRVEVARVEFERSLQVLYGLVPAPLTPVDVTSQLKNLRIIGQALTSNAQFSQSATVIEVSPVKIPCACQMCFACVRTQAR